MAAMKLKSYLTILGLSLYCLAFGQGFKPEKLIGKWESNDGKNFQIWTFKDPSHLQIYNNIHGPREKDTMNRIYRLEKIASSSFVLILHIEGDDDKTHESKDECVWLNNNQFKIKQPVELIGVSDVFTRTK